MRDYNNKMTMRRQQAILALRTFPYFILKNEIEHGYSIYTKELLEIQQSYLDYNMGAEFTAQGSLGDYIPSALKFKEASNLINKEARYMFSQTPDVIMSATLNVEANKEVAETYQRIVDSVLEKSLFPKYLLQSAKDCLIGKRIACLVDFSETTGIEVRFYNSLQFYYETEYDSNRITKFVTFKNVADSKNSSERLYLVNRYEIVNGVVYLSCKLYTGGGEVTQVLIEETSTELNEIPAVVITNDATLQNSNGVSEIDELVNRESGYSKLANADIDCDHKSMNPIRYTVDMDEQTTENLSSASGSYWDLRSNQNQNEVHPSVGTLAPDMQHTEAVKTTLARIRASMFAAVDVPDISPETLTGVITSGKTLQALYYPLTVRCNEKMKTWIPELKKVIKYIIELALLNTEAAKDIYNVQNLSYVDYKVNIKVNYALQKDEDEEKKSDLDEITANTRSRKSYIRKWRKDEFETDEQIDEELLQIATELNMFDTMSMNTQVQRNLEDEEIERDLEDDEEELETEKTLKTN